VFDILTRPAPELSREERDEVKKVAKELLSKLKGLLVMDWRRGQASRSTVRLAIEDALDEGLPRKFTPDIYKEKCSAVFDHFFEQYASSAQHPYSR
jgi:type I restriction enzyme, R subunit